MKNLIRGHIYLFERECGSLCVHAVDCKYDCRILPLRNDKKYRGQRNQ